jgi:F-type H+-transporting ATPase subunit epsilon
MAQFPFELITPEKVAFAGDVDQVDIPGSEGNFGVLANHAPLISLLRPGIVTVHRGGEQIQFVVLGGFAEVKSSGVTVLAEDGSSIEEVNVILIAEATRKAQHETTNASEGAKRHKASQRLHDLNSLMEALGLKA